MDGGVRETGRTADPQRPELQFLQDDTEFQSIQVIFEQKFWRGIGFLSGSWISTYRGCVNLGVDWLEGSWERCVFC